MAQVDGQALLMALQAVQAQIRLLSEEMDQAGEDGDRIKGTWLIKSAREGWLAGVAGAAGGRMPARVDPSC